MILRSLALVCASWCLLAAAQARIDAGNAAEREFLERSRRALTRI